MQNDRLLPVFITTAIIGSIVALPAAASAQTIVEPFNNSVWTTEGTRCSPYPGAGRISLREDIIIVDHNVYQVANSRIDQGRFRGSARNSLGQMATIWIDPRNNRLQIYYGRSDDNPSGTFPEEISLTVSRCPDGLTGDEILPGVERGFNPIGWSEGASATGSPSATTPPPATTRPAYPTAPARAEMQPFAGKRFAVSESACRGETDEAGVIEFTEAGMALDGNFGEVDDIAAAGETFLTAEFHFMVDGRTVTRNLRFGIGGGRTLGLREGNDRIGTFERCNFR